MSRCLVGGTKADFAIPGEYDAADNRKTSLSPRVGCFDSERHQTASEVLNMSSRRKCRPTNKAAFRQTQTLSSGTHAAGF
jgi:hypothetical protein